MTFTNTARMGMATIAIAIMPTAHAGDYSVYCSYKNENLPKCASVIADIVTDKFVAKFPAKRFEIFVHSNVHRYTNGGYTAYAITGVIPMDSYQFPLRRVSRTDVNTTTKVFNVIDLAEKELNVIRGAAEDLMAQCEISPNCDIYQPPPGKKRSK